ncbi:MAG: phosphoglucosamine mutase [Candidatus Bathyarchaeota archaeon]|nr:phosphoglucosamine mutase [Candidatus Bathyarchaeota archaeon]MDH5494574.1 phosphoglucosamine mutase [Candidatus Bathyarchaeota archaeon]
MEKPRRLFGTNGIRGVVNKELTPEFAIKIAEAIGTFFKQGKILLGYDGRISNIMLANAVTSGLISTGCDVYDAGMAPTPCIQYAVKNHQIRGGVMITASHNPPEYNGIKVMAEDGVEISRQQEVKIESLFFENKVNHVNWRRVGQRHVLLRVLDEYKEAVKKHADAATIGKKHYHVVVDAANGVGGLVTPYLLRELGCRVTTINANIDGAFPNRPPEPIPENLQDLAITVKAVGADFGVAFDGDADRSIFVDEKGEIQWGDRTFALIEKDFLQTNRGETIVTPVSSSQVVKDVAEKYGGKLVWVKVGSTIVSYTMKKLKAKLGGEENGGVFYGPHQPVRDAAMTTALILNIMAKTGRKLSQLLNELPRYHLEKDRMECPNEQKTLVLKKLVVKVKHLNPETIDGVKLWFPDKSSILIRPSGTEPVYRFYAEAEKRQKASKLVKEYKRKLQQIINP